MKHKIILTSVLTTLLLSSCGPSTTGGNGGANQNVLQKIDQKLVKPKGEIFVIPESSLVADGAFVVNLDKLVDSEKLTSDKLPYIKTIAPNSSNNPIEYDGKTRLQAGEVDLGSTGVFNFTTGAETLWVDKSVSFGDGTTVNVALSDQGSADFSDNTLFSTLQSYVLGVYIFTQRAKLTSGSLVEYGKQTSTSASSLIDTYLKSIESSIDSAFKGNEDPAVVRSKAEEDFGEISKEITGSIAFYSKITGKKPDDVSNAGIALRADVEIIHGYLEQMYDVLAKMGNLSGLDLDNLGIAAFNKLNGLKPLVTVDGTVDIQGTVRISNINKQKIARGSLFKLIASTKTATPTSPSIKLGSFGKTVIPANNPLKIFGANGNHDITKAQIAVVPSMDGNSLLLLALTDIAGSGSGGLGKFRAASAPNFAKVASSGGMIHFFNQLQTGMSFDINEKKADVNGFSFTSSSTTTQDASLNNFVSFSYNVGQSTSCGSYLNYSSNKDGGIRDFGGYMMTSLGGMNVLTSLTYGANTNQLFEDGMRVDTKEKILVGRSQLSHDFSFSNVTFTPKVFLGYGQMISNDVRKDGEKWNMSVDSTAAFGGLGLHATSKFKIQTMHIETFGSIEFASDLTSRSVTSDDESTKVSRSGSTVMLGAKALLDQNSMMYVTAKIENDDITPNQKFETGMKFKF